LRVIGTAGHVDHGKSTLVAALTGIHPDRLKEEQAREMTIELGFAWMNFPNGEEVGIVDVPGHRDFIENMLAGVGGIDAVLFVVAADEGVMPQTKEHLAILDILQVQSGVIALTKIDLVDNPEWLELVEMDVREAVRDTVLQNAPIIPVSARSGVGLGALVQALQECLAECPSRPDLGRSRLSIDRVFTILGFGTVVTGTLLDGQLNVGEEIEILPKGICGRVRGLQTHKRKNITALPGTRTAVNISGIELDQIGRGDVLARPGRYRPSQRIDVRFKLLQDVSLPMRHNMEVKFFIGASEEVARVRVLGTDEILPGQEGWLQLELEKPVVAVRGDHYILRRPSPSETLGGGTVVDPHPDQRHRRYAPEVLERLESLQHGTPAEILYQAALAVGMLPLKDVISRARLSEDQAQTAFQELVENGLLLPLESGSGPLPLDTVMIAQAHWISLTEKVLQNIAQYHQTYPLRRGMLREELKSRLKLSPRLFNLVMKRWISTGLLLDFGTMVASPQHQIKFTGVQQHLAQQLLSQFAQSPYSPPSVKECVELVGDEVFNALVDMKTLIQVSPEVAFRKQDYDTLLDAVKGHFSTQETLSAAQFRDRFNSSRRYALAFLEYLDSIGVTFREGDLRRMRKNA
jgi:selenocysteine-specific elongation factor